MEQVSHLGQAEQTSVHRADSHHEQRHADGIQDQRTYMRSGSQHVVRAGSNPNRKVSAHHDLIFTYVEDRPSWAACTDEVEEPELAQSSRYAHTAYTDEATNLSEPASPHDSDFGWDENTTDDHEQYEHSHWSTQSISSSHNTPITQSHTDSKIPALTTANLHLEAQYAPRPSPHDSCLTLAQVRHINRYGHATPDENIFDTQYMSTHELIPVRQRFQAHTSGNRDSMSFIEGGELDNNVDQSLLRHVQRQHEGISGHFIQLARRARAWTRR
jgi:hypothetical protein